MSTSLFDAVSMHCYWSTAGLTLDNALRYRRFPDPGRPRVVTECGRDQTRDGPNGTLLPPPGRDGYGWQAQNIDGDAYLRELHAYDAELRADGVFGVVFTTSPDDEWRRKGFDVDDLCDQLHGCTNLGPHDLLGTSPQALRWAEVAPIVKSCDQTAAIRRARHDAIRIYRRRFTPAEQDDILERCDAAHLVGAIEEGLDGFRHPNLYAELLNEVGKGRRHQYLRLARIAVPRLRAMGVRVAGPSWATGDWEQEDWAAFATEEAAVAQVKLIDISNWQQYPDLKRVKAAGYGGVIVKVSEDDYGDDDFYDPYAAGNWANAADAGLVRGVYTFVRPSKSAPAESVAVVQKALVKIGGLRAGDFVAVDTEDPLVPEGVSLHVWTAECLDLLERVLGFPPGKYSGKWYTGTRDLEHADLERWWTWWAAYQATKPAGTVGWRPIRIWQFSASARVPGVAGDCDVNLFDGTLDDLRALGKPAGPAPARVDWEVPVLAPINQGAQAVWGMPDKTADDEADATEVIEAMDRIKSRHSV